jgi:hypothetical protein
VCSRGVVVNGVYIHKTDSHLSYLLSKDFGKKTVLPSEPKSPNRARVEAKRKGRFTVVKVVPYHETLRIYVNIHNN